MTLRELLKWIGEHNVDLDTRIVLFAPSACEVKSAEVVMEVDFDESQTPTVGLFGIEPAEGYDDD